jgi:1-phosphofructokinase family hexose kinase
MMSGTAGTPLIITVTPNPSLDLLFDADRLVWDDANRLPDPRRRPGGQGINAARAARALGTEAVAVALLGGPTGAEIEAMLRADATPLHVVPAAADTRTFVAVRETSTGRSMLLNARGPRRTATDAAALAAAALDIVNGASRDGRFVWLACCGSVPDGFDTDFHARLAAAAAAAGAAVCVDCDGEPLRLAVAECDLLVPNEHEASRLTGLAVTDPRTAHQAARRLHGLRPGATIAVTLGAAGAVLLHDGAAWHARPPVLTRGSAVGAGDVFLAALLGRMRSRRPLDEPADALRTAVAAAAATLVSTGSAIVTPRDAEALIGSVEVSRMEGE